MRIKLKTSFVITLVLLYFKIGVGQPSLRVVKISENLNIDGILERIWQKADSSASFIQLEPVQGNPATHETIIKTLQDKTAIYFSFKCYIKRSDELVARIQRRDQLNFSDDIVTIILDTYNDNRTSLLFQVNAIGTISDAKINDDGRNIDYLWDSEWEVGTSITDNAWIAEIKIPFISIQFKTGIETWGSNFSRSVRANNEVSWWSPVNQNFRISQNGKLNNIQIDQGLKHSLTIFPYSTGRYTNANIMGIEDGFNTDFGGDIEYKYTSNSKMNLTLNPDFATVEGDKEEINLTPWELKFPEKRLFFQDGNDMFATRIQTFYSRRIGDIQYGGKATGKIDRFQFNGLHTQTVRSDKLGLPEAKYNALRIKADVLSSSTIGFIYADKTTDNETYRSYNFDYVLNLGKTWKLTGQYVASTPGDLKSHSAWFVRFAREDNIYHYHIRFTSLGENFRDNVNQTGFIPDDDRLEFDADVNYKFWLNKKLKYVYLSGKNNVFWSQQGILRSWRLNYGSRMYFDDKFSIDVYYQDEFHLLEKKYYNKYYHLITGYNTDEASNISLAFRFGKNFDRDFNLTEFKSNFKILNRLFVKYELDYLKYSPDPNQESTLINILGFDYFFTNDLWIQIFSQNNSSTDKFYFYSLLGWRFKPPFGAVYLIVNTDNYYNFEQNLKYYSNILFIKVTYPISVI